MIYVLLSLNTLWIDSECITFKVEWEWGLVHKPPLTLRQVSAAQTQTLRGISKPERLSLEWHLPAMPQNWHWGAAESHTKLGGHLAAVPSPTASPLPRPSLPPRQSCNLDFQKRVSLLKIALQAKPKCFTSSFQRDIQEYSREVSFYVQHILSFKTCFQFLCSQTMVNFKGKPNKVHFIFLWGIHLTFFTWYSSPCHLKKLENFTTRLVAMTFSRGLNRLACYRQQHLEKTIHYKALILIV